MQNNRPTIFRKDALKHYMRDEKRSSLLRFTFWPIALLLWALLGFFLVGGVFAWLGEVPTYVSGPGVILNNVVVKNEFARTHLPILKQALNEDEAIAVVFLPGSLGGKLRPGQTVQVQIGSLELQITSQIIHIEPNILSPDAAQQLYGCVARCSSFLTQPVISILVKLSAISATRYAGSVLLADITVGSRRIISLLPGLGG